MHLVQTRKGQRDLRLAVLKGENPPAYREGEVLAVGPGAADDDVAVVEEGCAEVGEGFSG